MVRILRLVQKQRRRATHVIDHDIHIAVVVDVPKGRAPARMQRPIIQARGIGNLVKRAIALVPIEMDRLAILQVVRQLVDHRADVAIGHKDTWPAIVIEVRKSRAPRHKLVRSPRQPRHRSSIGEA